MSQEKVLIRLDYCAERHLYVNRELPAFPVGAETLVEIQIASLEGLRKVSGVTDTGCDLGRSRPWCVSDTDLPEVFGPACVIAGLLESEAGWQRIAGDPLFIGQPRFLVDGAPIDGAFPLGFWGNALEVELDYLLTEEDFLLSVRQEAERLRAKVVGWRVVISAP